MVQDLIILIKNFKLNLHKTLNVTSSRLFPDLYYKSSFTFGKNNTTVDVVFIDTVVLCGNTADFERGTFIDILTHPQHEPMYPKDRLEANKHWKWINDTLNSSTADYLFVAGHYPVYSVASHGPTKCLLDQLIPRLEAYNVSAYFAGHEHSIQVTPVKKSVNSDPLQDIYSKRNRIR
ncbi:unnamed protein product [Cylicostephanus goldi]|uniref:Calcineurin-like phosphoesterase domain-containing protein n=1 Tax=Cylicostephanus goldi TaxID=71465 RepID=A0A3P6SMG9_CYLGO|nr:unnamed protein product [Cylicostephanus goldi]